MHLDDWNNGTSEISAAALCHLIESAKVCLEACGHSRRATLHVEGDESIDLTWDSADTRAAASHADAQEATEDGAVGIALRVVAERCGAFPIRRSKKGTGFDWHLGPTTANNPYGGAALEVSGILREDETLMRKRLEQKRQQVKRGGMRLPSYVVVVGFTSPRAAVEQVVP